MQVLNNPIKIKLNYGELKEYLDWCERNCVGNFKYMEDPNGPMYDSWIFFFENVQDYATFLLWKK